ncbi:MAG: FtsK/SpoIIIE domain-containing protein [Bacteriovoracaceae bacterium]|nr:FtsK/SpoIIIE domain-containing protein [Bacteriovoracaceae bacterium]
MEKKILRAQLYSLFILTTLNLIYFYYRDNLPDNYYEISYQNESINFFTYYFFTLLANFGYWCGIWITVSFITFALLHSFVLTKQKDIKNQLVIAVLLPLTLGLCYFLLPVTLGEGLLFLIQENISTLTLAVSIIFFGISFFYLVSEKQFFKTCNLIWKNVLAFGSMLKEIDISQLKEIDVKKWHESIKERFLGFIASFRQEEPVAAPVSAKLKITDSTKIKAPVTPKPLPVVIEEIEEEIDEDELEEDEEILDEVEELEEEEDSEEFNDSIDDDIETEDSESKDDFEEVDSPFITQVNSDPFFESDELINCIVPKDQTSHQNDPDDGYFVTIARAIEEKLKEFNITSHIINVLKGPVVDTFELDLGPGVKVNAVTNRVDDLSLALKGAPIRMVYPMKGKTTIGIEVPRNPRDLIYLDEVLRSQAFKDSSYRLPIAMGKDAYGDAAVIDLASTPHFLVAGTTGAGKSVFVNTLLVSLIIKLSPKKLRLIMIDPKQLELALYQKLPHLVMPVITDSSIASVALLWAIDEMERRYSILKDFAVKNIEGFNKKMKVAGTDLTCKINKYYPDAEVVGFEMPYIVIVVDEFADLKLSKSGPAIETAISRLAAKARASGIHIVLATQRPSTDVITGVIKANFPTRVAFRVTTNMDSRVIMDTPGAEKLLGKGDMLFKQGIETLRMHSAYVDEEEIEKLVEKLSTLPIQYDTGAMEFIETNGIVDTDVDGVTTDGEGGGLKDDKYDEAVRTVATHRVASASFLQRRLGVGYNRAANLIEEMERHGVVGPAQGSKPRKVLVPPPSDSTP